MPSNLKGIQTPNAQTSQRHGCTISHAWVRMHYYYSHASRVVDAWMMALSSARARVTRARRQPLGGVEGGGTYR